MMRSLFSGVTGLRSHQTRMDVIGNNIANVNTVGFKKSTVTFKDLYSETISAAAAASGTGAGTTGGVNPKQIGLGAAVNSISVVHTPGSAQYTGNGMDVAISGDGYFVVQTPTGNMYTRAGNFYTDQAGNLVTADGYYVQTVAPSEKAVMQHTFDGVSDQTMLSTTMQAPAGGVIQTGNVTANLGDTIGKTYHFEFVADATNPWTATMNYSNYIPAGKGNVKINPDTPWSKAVIEKAVYDKAVADPTTSAGNLKLHFVQDGNNVNLMVGDILLGDIDYNTEIADGAIEAPLDFDGFELKVTNETGDDLGIVDLVDSLNTGLQPTISLSQNGNWQLRTDDGIVEEVTLGATARAGGGYEGDIKISTTNFGTFTLKTKEGGVNNLSELSDDLGDSTFQVNVNSDWAVEYESPGQVLEASLKTMTIDFDLYSSLAIDSKGAIVAQLKQDRQLNVGGQKITQTAGEKIVLGYVSLANFNNPTGLEKMGDNLYALSANSGTPTFNMPGSGSAGMLSPSNLEMSNVDLSEEIVNMIITQRGFQANSRIITTTDTMLEELVNLKR